MQFIDICPHCECQIDIEIPDCTLVECPHCRKYIEIDFESTKREAEYDVYY